MSTPKLQQWLYVEISTLAYSDLTSSTYKLSNRPVLKDSSTGTYFPILLEVGKVGSQLDNYIPFSSNSTVTINNTPNSFGYERRFSDILERENIIGQSIKLYYAETELSDLNVTSDFTLAWTATILDYEIGRVLTLNISTVSIPARMLGRTLTGSSLPAGSRTQFLPMVFGSNVELKPYRLDADGDTSPSYAYASTLGTDYPLEGVQSTYVKKSDGTYVAFTPATNTSTLSFGNTGTANDKINHLSPLYEYIAQLPVSVTCLLSKLKIQLYNDDLFSVDTTISFTLYESITATGQGRKVLYEFKLALPTASLAAGYYTYYLTPTEPILLESTKGYYLGMVQNAGTDWWWAVDNTAGTTTNYFRVLANGDQGPWSTLGSQYKWLVGGYGLVVTDYQSGSGTVDSDGFGYAYFEITQNAADSVYTDPTNLDLLIIANGLTDNVSGTITGTPYQLLEAPHHIIEALDKEWSGSAWTGGIFDFTQFSDTHAQLETPSSKYYRKIAGATQQKMSLSELYEEICRNSGCRISLINSASAKLALYAWGTERSSVATITDEDTIGEVTVVNGGTDYVLNKVLINYDRSLIDKPPSDLGNNNARFSQSLDWYPELNQYVYSIAALSKFLYGKKELVNTEYGLIQDITSATSEAERLLRTYRFAFSYVFFSVPLYKFKTLKHLDVITVIHPDLPSYFGTTSNAALPTYTGIPVDLLAGDYMKRAKLYRAQIETREVVFDSNSIAKLNIGARLLLNYPIDPT